MAENDPNAASMTIQQAFDLAARTHQAGKLSEAEKIYRQILIHQPNHADTLHLLGVLLGQKGQHHDAAEFIRRAIQVNPAAAIFFINLGITLEKLESVQAAIDAYREAIRLQPDAAEAYNNLGNIYRAQGQIATALETFCAAIKAKPDMLQTHNNFIYTMYFHPDFDARAIHEEQRRWNQIHAEPLKKFVQPHTNNPDPERRLKIGYISADFREHPSDLFLDPLLRNHNHEHFEIFCYAQIIAPDSATARYRSYADRWRNIVQLTDQQVVELIRNNGIDILVDLKLHTAENRLRIFAYKPAPVQVTWLGYPGSTGLDTIDYRLSDPYLDPPEMDVSIYSEQTLRLPDCFWCYDPLSEEKVSELPALKNGHITFGCLNQFPKINARVLEIWARIFSQLPNSHLLLLAPPGRAREFVLTQLQQTQIDPKRVEFVDRLTRSEYLKQYQRIDLVLDPFPCNGHTTTFDSLWMGVPAVSLSGKTAMGRAGKSILTNISLPELAAQTPEEYMDIAVKLANDLPRLVELRRTLRKRMENSPLMDAKRFARNMEAAYRQMWRRWCDEVKENV